MKKTSYWNLNTRSAGAAGPARCPSASYPTNQAVRSSGLFRGGFQLLTALVLAGAGFFGSGSASAAVVQFANGWTTGLTHVAGPGSDRLLVFVVTIESAGGDVTSVTYGGQSMTEAVEDVYVSGDGNRVEIWYLDEAGIQAASGTTFVPTYSVGPDVALHAARTFANVNQSAPITDTASTNGTNATLTTPAFSVVAGGMAVSGTSHEGGGSYSNAAWGAGWVEGTDQATGTTQGTGNTASAYGANGTDTATATHSASGRHALVAASLASGGGTAADLEVTKTVDDATPTEGDTIVYTVVLDNNGPDATTNVTVTDLLPAGVTYVSDIASKGSYVSGTGIWTVGSMANGASETLTITATVDAGTGGSTIVNTASVSATDVSDPISGNDSDTANITVQTADLSLTKTDTPDPAPLNGPLLYTLLVTNNGPHTATGVTVTDTLPASVTLVSAIPNQGSCSGVAVVTCNLGSILNSGTASIEILVTTNAAGTISNTASVTANEVDPVPADNTANEDTDVVVGGTTDIPLTQYTRMHGFLDYVVTGGTLRTGDGSGQRCDIAASSSENLAGIPGTATIRAAYLYWAASGVTPDTTVTLDAAPVTADRTFEADFVLGATTYEFFGGFEDITAQVTAKRNGLYTFAGLTIDNGNPWCSAQAVLGGWSMYVIYEDTGLSGKTLVFYDGFDLERNGSTSYLLTGIYASAPPEAKTTPLLWEGDASLGGTTEQLLFNASALSDALNPVNNIYNGTINSLAVNTSYGVDLDTFDVSGLVNDKDTLATTQVDTGPDLVILNSVLLQVKTNIIAGTVFEDVNYGGGVGRDLATAVAAAPTFTVPRPGATLELYDAGGNFIRTTVTDTNGDYGFTGLPDGDYTVRVVNETVTSSRPGASGTEWPVQTFRTDATGATVVAVTGEVGGTDPTAEDDPANTGAQNLAAITAQSLAPVTISASIAKAEVDFGYNFDTIVNTNNTGQGSLAQFIDNSNALTNANLAQDGLTAGTEHSLFMIPSDTDPQGRPQDPNFDAGRGVAEITITSALPGITDADTAIDGTTQTTSVGNTNAGLLGTGGTAGVDGLAVSQVAAPEVEIHDDVAPIVIGLQVQANDTTVRGLAMFGFGDDNGEAAILIDNNFTGALIEDNVLGTRADSFTDPGAASRGWAAIESLGGDGGIIRDNLLGFNGIRGIFLRNTATGWTVQGNEMRDNGLSATDGDGIAFSDASSNTITGNLIAGSSSQGIVVTNSSANVFTNNTLSGNGVGTLAGVIQSAGITLRSTASATTFDRNIVDANYGAGIQVNNGATGIQLTQNSIVDNGTIIARDSSPATGQIGIDLNAPGDDSNLGTPPYFTLNDVGDADAGGNTLLNFPVITSAVSNGSTTTVSGTLNSAPGTTFTLEFFSSTAADASGYGEGETYRGSDTVLTDGGGNGGFTTVLPVAVPVGHAMSVTSTDPALNTSEFSDTMLVGTDSPEISGVVFEDVNYGGGAGRDQATASGIVRSGARVELYDATGTYVTFTTTDGSGNYSFPGLAAANYTVRVANSSVTSSRTGYVPGLLGVQTYRTDASSGSAVADTTRVGGQDPSVTDAGNGSAGAVMNTTTGVFTAIVTGTAQSITNVTLGASDTTGVDFGYNFDTIVNTNNTGQGSLAQFIDNSNALTNASLAQNGLTAGTEHSLFMIPSDADPLGRPQDPTFDAARGVAVITITSALPGISDADTAIDGTTQTTNIGNTNSVTLGVGGTVGVDALVLSQFAGPEVEIRAGAVLGIGLHIQANDVTVRGLAIMGFTAATGGAVTTAAGTDAALIEDNILGSAADAFGDPGPGLRNYAGVQSVGGTNGIIRDNLMGFGRRGVQLTGASTGWTVQGNEIRDNELASTDGDGITIRGTSSGNTVTGNLITGSSSQGFVIADTASSTDFINNTVSGNGVGTATAVVQSTGITMRPGANTTTIDRNVITANYGAGVQVNNGASGILLTRNSFADNGTIVARDSSPATGQIGIDLNSPTDDVNLGTPPYFTLNDVGDADAGGNTLLNFPVITSAVSNGSTTTVSGTLNSAPGTTFTLEFFSSTAADASGYGEGETYRGSDTVLTDGGGNGGFTTVLPVAVPVGHAMSVTSTDPALNTSEFSDTMLVGTDLVITKRAFFPDGTPIPNTATVPSGMLFHFLLYINNPNGGRLDVSLQDVLDPGFVYETETLRIDNSLANCAAPACTPAEEAAIFTSVAAAPLLSDAVDADTVSFTGGDTIDAGNQNAANAQLDIAGNSVLALLMSVRFP